MEPASKRRRAGFRWREPDDEPFISQEEEEVEEQEMDPSVLQYLTELRPVTRTFVTPTALRLSDLSNRKLAVKYASSEAATEEQEKLGDLYLDLLVGMEGSEQEKRESRLFLKKAMEWLAAYVVEELPRRDGLGREEDTPRTVPSAEWLYGYMSRRYDHKWDSSSWARFADKVAIVTVEGSEDRSFIGDEFTGVVYFTKAQFLSLVFRTLMKGSPLEPIKGIQKYLIWGSRTLWPEKLAIVCSGVIQSRVNALFARRGRVFGPEALPIDIHGHLPPTTRGKLAPLLQTDPQLVSLRKSVMFRVADRQIRFQIFNLFQDLLIYESTGYRPQDMNRVTGIYVSSVIDTIGKKEPDWTVSANRREIGGKRSSPKGKENANRFWTALNDLLFAFDFSAAPGMPKFPLGPKVVYDRDRIYVAERLRIALPVRYAADEFEVKVRILEVDVFSGSAARLSLGLHVLYSLLDLRHQFTEPETAARSIFGTAVNAFLAGPPPYETSSIPPVSRMSLEENLAFLPVHPSYVL